MMTMKNSLVLVLPLLARCTNAFSTLLVKSTGTSFTTGLFGEIDRRSLLGMGAAAAVAHIAQVRSIQIPLPAFAAEPTKVVVAGATGQTGRRVLGRLAGKPGLIEIGGVCNVDAAQKLLAESLTVI